MALLEVLDRHGVQYDKEETQKRYDLLIKGLRRDPTFEKDLAEFKKESPKKGGGEYDIPIPVKMTKDDYLGSEARWFVDVMTSPYAQVVIRLLFLVLFFVSYLEKIPTFGSILSAVLDITLAGGRVLIKTIQRLIPPAMSFIPLPFMNFVGMGVAAVFGMILWPILAMIAFSRQDFTSAIESFVRAIPPPLGDGIADAFLDANRTVYRLDEKRKKLVEDLTNGLRTIMEIGNQTGTRIGQGAETLIGKAKEAVAQNPLSKAKESFSNPLSKAKESFSNPLSKAKDTFSKAKGAFSFGSGRFSRKVHKNKKWRKTRRQNS